MSFLLRDSISWALCSLFFSYLPQPFTFIVTLCNWQHWEQTLFPHIYITLNCIIYWCISCSFSLPIQQILPHSSPASTNLWLSGSYQLESHFETCFVSIFFSMKETLLATEHWISPAFTFVIQLCFHYIYFQYCWIIWVAKSINYIYWNLCKVQDFISLIILIYIWDVWNPARDITAFLLMYLLFAQQHLATHQWWTGITSRWRTDTLMKLGNWPLARHGSRRSKQTKKNDYLHWVYSFEALITFLHIK